MLKAISTNLNNGRERISLTGYTPIDGLEFSDVIAQQAAIGAWEYVVKVTIIADNEIIDIDYHLAKNEALARKKKPRKLQVGEIAEMRFLKIEPAA